MKEPKDAINDITKKFMDDTDRNGSILISKSIIEYGSFVYSKAYLEYRKEQVLCDSRFIQLMDWYRSKQWEGGKGDYVKQLFVKGDHQKLLEIFKKECSI